MMETKTGFFEDSPGQKSSLRLNLFELLQATILILIIACIKSPAGQPLQIHESVLYMVGFMLLLVFAPKLVDKFFSLKFGANPNVPADSGSKKEEGK